MMINAGGKMFQRPPVFLSGANYIYSFRSLYDNSNSVKRPGAELDGNPPKIFKTDSIRNRSVLMERAVHKIDDLKNLKFEAGQIDLYTVFTERRWTGRILEAKGEVYSDIVYDFYEQLRNSNRHHIQLAASVREVKVVISPKEIASFLHLPRKHPNPRSSHDEQYVDEIHRARALTGTDHVQHDMNGNINVKDMLRFFQMSHLIVAANIKPTNPTTDMISINQQGKFLLDIAHGVDFDLPRHIFNTIKNAVASRSSTECLPFGQLITGLSLKAGVKPRPNEKEVKPAGPIHIHIRVCLVSEMG